MIETITNEQSETILDLMLPDFGTPTQVKRAIRNRTMFLLMLDAGLRVGELVNLRRDDLTLNGNVLTSLRVRKEIAKGHRERLIPLSSRLIIALGEMQKHIWVRHTTPISPAAFYKMHNYKQITPRQVERIVAKYSKLAIGEPIHPHTLRHTFATRHMGITSLRNVQVLLGHKNLSTTQIYTHPNNQDLKSAIASLDVK